MAAKALHQPVGNRQPQPHTIRAAHRLGGIERLENLLGLLQPGANIAHRNRQPPACIHSVVILTCLNRDVDFALFLIQHRVRRIVDEVHKHLRQPHLSPPGKDRLRRWLPDQVNPVLPKTRLCQLNRGCNHLPQIDPSHRLAFIAGKGAQVLDDPRHPTRHLGNAAKVLSCPLRLAARHKSLAVFGILLDRHQRLVQLVTDPRRHLPQR